MKKLTREWVKKAEDDYCAVEHLARAAKPFHDQVCFHSQQSAEKYLKALLQEHNLPVPRTHDLVRLLELLRGPFPVLVPLRRGLKVLTDHAVDSRYPGDAMTKRQAATAERWATVVRLACRQLLGLKPKA
jgi:HEPN domain-containing protein